MEHSKLEDPVHAVIHALAKLLLDVDVKVFRICLSLAIPPEERVVKMTYIGLPKLSGHHKPRLARRLGQEQVFEMRQDLIVVETP